MKVLVSIVAVMIGLALVSCGSCPNGINTTDPSCPGYITPGYNGYGGGYPGSPYGSPYGMPSQYGSPYGMPGQYGSPYGTPGYGTPSPYGPRPPVMYPPYPY